MKTLGVAAAAAALFGSTVVLPIAADAAGIAGYLDPSTGAFTAVQNVVPPASLLTRTGKITVIVTVQIDSSIPADQPITCNVSIGSNDFPNITNNASGQSGVVRSGNSGKCTTIIPYIWLVASAKTMMTASAGVTTGSGFSTGSVSHSASIQFTAFPVPNGSKTLTVNVAL